MTYTNLATAKTPALVIYLLDVSASMQENMGGKSRVQTISDALEKVIIQMVQRSTKGTIVSPRYKVGMYAYSNEVIDILGGIKSIDEVAQMGVPDLSTLSTTDSAKAFKKAEEVLSQEIPNLSDSHPAPLVCHMTDGEFTGADPEPIAKNIMSMSVADGNVLLENIYVSDVGVTLPSDIKNWSGINDDSQLSDTYSKKLYNISSPVPKSYLTVMGEFGYKLEDGARMFFPAAHEDLVKLGFAMSGATPVTSAE